MTEKPRVLITGASGLIGRLVLRDLSDRYAFSGLSRRPVDGIPHTVADITDLDAVRWAMRGVDMVVHLAAETEDYNDWEKVQRITMGGTLNMFRAAQEAGVRRVVFASAGSTMIGYEWYAGSPTAGSPPANSIACRKASGCCSTPIHRGPTPSTASASCSASTPAGCSPIGTACRCWSSASAPCCPTTSRRWCENCPAISPIATWSA
ncbi:MAG: NAD-dependent epimerase/dehydratase family protein [Devosia sp.]|nr:NAD-dependent epimerase/dehydratase family protein [Devosia sp.]